ncbi:MAG: hypothetical protein Q7S40_27000 [Opitutaceae bacterium]|nr:hypothetical protein [Opitutaceae bacterium]
MRLRPATILSALLLLAVGVPAQPAGAPAAKSNAAQPKKQRPMPQAEWLDPDRGAPNGTEYRTMGGYGAAHLGFKYPELFGTVVINAGALIDPNPTNLAKDGPMFGVFGTDTARRVSEHPFTLVRKNATRLRATHIRIGCGSEDGLLALNRQLHTLLTELGLEHAFEIVPGVAHEPPRYFRELGTKVYAFHARSLQSTHRGEGG